MSQYFIQCHTGNMTAATKNILYGIFPLTETFVHETGDFGYKNKAFSYKIQATFIKSYSMPLMFHMLLQIFGIFALPENIQNRNHNI